MKAVVWSDMGFPKIHSTLHEPGFMFLATASYSLTAFLQEDMTTSQKHMYLCTFVYTVCMPLQALIHT